MPQDRIAEQVHILEAYGELLTIDTGTPSLTEELGKRLDLTRQTPNHWVASAIPLELAWEIWYSRVLATRAPI